MKTARSTLKNHSLYVKLAFALVLIVLVIEVAKASLLFVYDGQNNPSMDARHGVVWRFGSFSIEDFQVGDVVAFRVDDRLTAAFPEGTLFMKQIAAMPGDVVELTREHVLINGEKVADMPMLDRISVDLDKLLGEKEVMPGEAFVLGVTETSLDSRYWGMMKNEQLKGRVIWRW